MTNKDYVLSDLSHDLLLETRVKKRERVARECVCCGSMSLKKSPAVLMPFVAHRVFDWRPVEIDESWGLKTIKSGHAYSICNSLCCDECGLLFLDIRFSDEEMSLLYSNYRDQKYINLREQYEPGYTKLNNEISIGLNYISDIESFLAPFVSHPLSILDWGGDTGANTPFKNKSKKHHVYDISNVPAIDGAEKVSRETALYTSYDLIICSNVLEHVPYPLEVLMEIKGAIKNETLLYIEVPYEEVMKNQKHDRLCNKKHWHEHINFFSMESLSSIIEACDLCIIEKKLLPVNILARTSTLLQILCKLK